MQAIVKGSSRSL